MPDHTTRWGWRRPGDRAQTIHDDPTTICVGLPDWIALPDDPAFGHLAGEPCERIATVKRPDRPNLVQDENGEWERADPMLVPGESTWHLLAHEDDLLRICIVEGVGCGFAFVVVDDLDLARMLVLAAGQRSYTSKAVVVHDTESGARDTLDALREVPDAH